MPGDLAETSPVDVCLHLAGERATGTLVMSGPRGDAVLVLADGRLAGARPPATGRGARLGERLVSAGRLDRPDLDAVLAEQSASEAPTALGQMLIERGLVSPDVVRLFVQEQILETLLDAISWFEGSWDFAEAGTAEPGAVRVAIPVDRALMEVRRRATERDRVAAVVPSSSVVPRPVRGSDRPPGLSADAFTVLTAVDGTRSVAAIASALGFSYDDTARQLFRLALQELVEVADNRETTVPTAPSVPDPAPESAPTPEAPTPDEEDALSAFPATGTPTPLADDGWAERRHEAAATIDEPEPWVGWADGAPVQPVEPEPTPAAPAAPAAAAEQHVEPPTRPESSDRLWASAPTSPAPGPPPSAAPRGDIDADTRRALFSELHEVGRANPSLSNGAPEPARPASPDPGPGHMTARPDEVAVPEPDPAPASLSSSDVSDLLRELHALNLDDD